MALKVPIKYIHNSNQNLNIFLIISDNISNIFDDYFPKITIEFLIKYGQFLNQSFPKFHSIPKLSSYFFDFFLNIFSIFFKIRIYVKYQHILFEIFFKFSQNY